MDPKTAAYINMAAAALAFTVTASADLTAIVGPNATNLIVHSAAYFGGLIAAVNAAMHWYAPAKPGPGTTP